MGKQQFKRITITLPEDLVDKYQQYCRNEGMNLSSRIAVLLRKDIEKS